VKNILVLLGLGLLVSALVVTACSSPERSQVANYLSELDKIDNALNQTAGSVLASTDTSDPVAISDAVNKYTSAIQSAIQGLDTLTVPAIPDVQSQFNAYKSALQARLDALKQLEGAMVHGDDAGYNDAYNQFVDAGKGISGSYRLFEALLNKYNLTDAQVNYKSRGK
jgi:hypothetical protein